MTPVRTFPWSCAALLACALPAPARAQGQVLPYAGLQLEYNSNVFALPSEEQAELQTGEDKLDDFVLRGVAGLALDWPIGRQRLRVEAEGRYEQYLHFDELAHADYRYGAALDWRLSDSFDGNVAYREERRMPSFVERPGTELVLETERGFGAGANLQLNPTWRLETALRARDLETPLPEDPQFALEEQAARAALNYLGAQSLVLGTYLEYLTGEYFGEEAGEFTEESYGFRASYGVPKLYGIGVEVGYTDRQDERSNLSGVAAPTGRIGYRRALSGKTVVGLNAFREINSNVLEGGFVDEYGVEAAITVQATGKSEAAAGYQFRRSSFQDVGNSGFGGGREDRLHTFALRWTWEPLSWLLVRTHAGWQSRDSNQPVFRFDGLVLGVGFVVARRPPDDTALRQVGVRRDLIDGVLPQGSIPQ